MPKFILFSIVVFCKGNHLVGQPSKFQIQLGVISNITWLGGENKLSNVGFSKNLQKPSLFTGFSFDASNFLTVSLNTCLQPLSTDYVIPSVDILNRPVELEYRNISLYFPFTLQLTLTGFSKFRTKTNFGIFTSVAHSSKWKGLNLDEFDVPTFAPRYGEFKLNKWNYGLQLGISQPLYRWKLSSLDLGIQYALGLKNVNRDDENRLKTKMVGVTLLWNVNMKRRYEKEK